MPRLFDKILKGGTILNQNGVFQGDLGLRAGKITEFGFFSEGEAEETINCTGLHILPGVIDTQVHFREPGLTNKEDLESGSRAAVLGGVTCVFEMPNTLPPTTTQTALEDKIRAAQGRMHCDYAFWVGATQDNLTQLSFLESCPAVAGIKVFMGSSTGSLLLEEEAALRQVLRNARRRVAVHAEDEARLRERKAFQRNGDPSSHPVWRDAETALRASQRLVKLVQEEGALLHILHLSTKEEVALLKEYKDLISLEVTPHHLTLEEDAYLQQGTLVQMNPPIRGGAHKEHLWWGVQQGVIDILGSDHAPHLRSEKARTYPTTPSGMPGVQTLVPIMLEHVAAGNLTLERFVDMTSAGPARLFGLAGKGRLAVGYDADLTVVDLARQETITDSWIASHCGWTPYHGKKVRGWPVGTFVQGQCVMWEGTLLMPGAGRPARFQSGLHKK